jgi:hypothetical protein
MDESWRRRFFLDKAITVPICMETNFAVNINKTNNMNSYEWAKEIPVNTKNGIHSRHIPISGYFWKGACRRINALNNLRSKAFSGASSLVHASIWRLRGR